MQPLAVADFFRRYAELSMADDPTGLAVMYAASFLVAGPKGSATFENDEAFLEWLRSVHEANVQTGLLSMRFSRLTFVHELSPTHTLATVEWDARFDKTGIDTPIRFEITYTLEDLGAGAKVIAYISHADQEDEMRRLGLL